MQLRTSSKMLYTNQKWHTNCDEKPTKVSYLQNPYCSQYWISQFFENKIKSYLKKIYTGLSSNQNIYRWGLNLSFLKKTWTGDVSRPFGRSVYRFGCPNSCAQKTLFKFCFFSVVFQQKICWSSNQWFRNASN